MTTGEKIALAGVVIAGGYPVAKLATWWVVKTLSYWQKHDVLEEEVHDELRSYRAGVPND